MAVQDITSATQAVTTGSFAPVEQAAATYAAANELRSLLVDHDDHTVCRDRQRLRRLGRNRCDRPRSAPPNDVAHNMGA